jgi:hypothetical protein
VVAVNALLCRQFVEHSQRSTGACLESPPRLFEGDGIEVKFPAFADIQSHQIVVKPRGKMRGIDERALREAVPCADKEDLGALMRIGVVADFTGT